MVRDPSARGGKRAVIGLLILLMLTVMVVWLLFLGWGVFALSHWLLSLI